MSDTPSEGPEDLEEAKEFVEQHKMSVEDGLSRLVDGHTFVLVGENHSNVPEANMAREAVATSLEKLKEHGLTHVVVEADRQYQKETDDLDSNDPDSKTKLDKITPGGFWNEGNDEIILEAKRLGLRVVFADHTNEELRQSGDDSYAGRLHSERDKKIYGTLQEELTLDPEAKTLIYFGDAHIQQHPTE